MATTTDNDQSMDILFTGQDLTSTDQTIGKQMTADGNELSAVSADNRNDSGQQWSSLQPTIVSRHQWSDNSRVQQIRQQLLDYLCDQTLTLPVAFIVLNNHIVKTCGYDVVDDDDDSDGQQQTDYRNHCQQVVDQLLRELAKQQVIIIADEYNNKVKTCFESMTTTTEDIHYIITAVDRIKVKTFGQQINELIVDRHKSLDKKNKTLNVGISDQLMKDKVDDSDSQCPSSEQLDSVSHHNVVYMSQMCNNNNNCVKNVSKKMYKKLNRLRNKSDTNINSCELRVKVLKKVYESSVKKLSSTGNINNPMDQLRQSIESVRHHMNTMRTAGSPLAAIEAMNQCLRQLEAELARMATLGDDDGVEDTHAEDGDQQDIAVGGSDADSPVPPSSATPDSQRPPTTPEVLTTSSESGVGNESAEEDPAVERHKRLK
ncbi:uncharacterized protein LOC128957751 [Oppia nitens]|uniref:uncharacterized protein LOC128957751 n=1 Tax=Oppia nitens TaxID=1686743 RepID=UPI0023DC18AB|nr:uncharacterized protein LOC128957751 [Oppia nitens]